MNYTVTFVQYYTYEVEAENDQEAENKAYEEFRADMCCPIAHTHYDDVEVECDEEDYDA